MFCFGKHFPVRLWPILLLPLIICQSGCLGPVSLQKAVMGYDEAISRVNREMLLLNIVRSREHLPQHFTLTSNIAATFDYQTTAGIQGTLYSSSSGLNSYGFNLGATVAENPTLSIVPMQGEEFTSRILTPLDESKFLFLVFQGAALDMVMRLMADGIEVQNADGTFKRFILNWPSRPGEYEEFLKIASRLAQLNYNRQLFVGRLDFEESQRAWLPDNAASSGFFSEAIQSGYHWQRIGAADLYELTKSKTGRVIVTNYDPRTLTNVEKQALNGLADANPNNFVLLDIRPGFPGGEFPLFGALKLRSLNVILEFVAAGIVDRTKSDKPGSLVGEKSIPEPQPLMTILVDQPTPPGGIEVSAGGHTYAVQDKPWDSEVFKLLCQLFQSTVQSIAGVGAPSITIAK